MTWINNKISKLADLTPKAAQVGIEIEMEFNKFGAPHVAGWDAKEDPSLRGSAIEYVSNPMMVVDVPGAVNRVYDSVAAAGLKVSDSMRAGVHIHYNCLDKSLSDVITFAQIYYILENMLVQESGNSRAGNLFCLRASDADFVLGFLSDCLRNRAFADLANDNIRYCSLNYTSLPKYGTLEFRSLRTPTNPEPIIQWVNEIHHLMEQSSKYSMVGVIEAFSILGAEQFCKELLGPYWPKYQKHYDPIQVIRGMRNGQRLCNYQLT